ncbi:MAG: ATP synthase F1 subunit gamma [Holosporaceae bacterium]|jgi:F-type H+-transporting ATPase subunit gamma|nr:ATP synthase F1 subunit gamma [Holosporaceae bacterium]
MANLKELRDKIGVIQSTRKVTAAMKLVAGVKLRKTEHKAEISREYALELENILLQLQKESGDLDCELLYGRKQVTSEMLLVLASDRGLCGNFNYLIIRKTALIISELHRKNQKIHLLCLGNKIAGPLKRMLNKDDSLELIDAFYKDGELFENSKRLAAKIISDFTLRNIDKSSIIYTRYHSIMKRSVDVKNLIPAMSEQNQDPAPAMIIFEPNIDNILKNLIPYNIAVQIYQSVLESLASEHSSRMTSMDNATRNADELLSNLNLKYNRLRQYGITQELTEIVSGAEAISRG